MPSHGLIFVLVVLIIDSVHLKPLSPIFPQNVSKIMPEDCANGSLITSFTVTDEDSASITLGIFDDFTRQSVYLNQTNGSPGVVTGHIYLINTDSFDFDRGKSEVNLAFSASDGDGNTSTGFVQVYVTDVNDNPPVFRRPAYVYDIPENSTYPSNYSANISATDADDGVNKAFAFKLAATGQSSELYKDVFNIDKNNGHLILKKPLDYETLSFYQYIIEAVDSGNPPLTGTAEITITVTDIQDTPPNFKGLPYIFAIKENSSWAGKDILAQDGDRGIPRNINYTMVYYSDECSKLFEINTATGRFSIKDKLDRDTGIVLENQGVCRIGIEAEEITKPGEPTTNSAATTTVTVMVEDLDDNVPTFNKSHYDAYIEEDVSNIPINIVGSTGIEVFDLDQGPNSKFSLTVRYTNGSRFTGIEATPSLVLSRATVLLRLVNGFEFDYETEQTITLLVVANENTNPRLFTTCTVAVYINNTNDNDPEFSQDEYNATIPESPPTGTSVTVVTAEDLDLEEYGKLTYTLKGSSQFGIDPHNGTVYTVGSPGDLDRETRDTYYLTVVATDRGNRRAVASLTVILSDINDNPPRFLYKTVEMSITENTTQFNPDILVTATDIDESNTPNSEVMYRLKCPDNLNNNFTINSTTGEIIATQPLDYERLYLSQNGQIQLIVIAYDNGNTSLESNTTVTINVHDINDNTPKFHQDSYNANISENSTPGKSVDTVSASDGDATSPNNEVRYYIEKGGSDLFRINGQNGTITVDLNAKFDRESQDQYNLTIIAADIGTPPRTVTVTLAIRITDINDESPEFGQSSYIASEKEDIAIGYIVKNCTASDADNDNELEYDIQTHSATDGAGNSVKISLVEHMFSIHPTNGSVFVSNSLDRETASQVTLIIIVNDTKCAEHCPQTAT
ncbi:protein dachsous-like, partial [Mizuhopecten yessoensis]|uniref:protein dachsous-like n=1 Tax=Mizuhopecten yessoensis TaxID=6573 RepID=UPI000B45DB91